MIIFIFKFLTDEEKLNVRLLNQDINRKFHETTKFLRFKNDVKKFVSQDYLLNLIR